MDTRPVSYTITILCNENANAFGDNSELMYHYGTNTACGQLGAREAILTLWRHYIPKQALTHVFLMHGLLALAALHLAYLNPKAQVRYLQLCDKHQSVALQQFRTVLSSDISPELADALFALSAVISISSMARSCVVDGTTSVDADAIAEVFFLTRGVADVIRVHYEHIRAGPMGKMFENQHYPEGTEVVLPPLVARQFERIREMLSTYGLDPGALEHCQKALSDLEDVYQNILYFGSTTQLETGQVFRWKVMVPTGYIRLVQARNPPALIIMAYYAAALTAIRTAWYTENFAEYALRGISLELDAAMQHFLTWPKQQLEERMAILGAQPAKFESSTPNPLIAGH